MEMNQTPPSQSPVQGTQTENLETSQAPQSAEPKAPEQNKFDVKAQWEKQRVRQMQEFKQRESQLLARQKEIDEKYAQVQKFEQAKKNARMNPDQFLETVGLSYDDYTQFKLNNNNPTYEAKFQSLEEKMETMFKEQELREQKRQEEFTMRQQQQAEAAVERYKNDVSEFVEANKTKYKFVDAYEGQDFIIEAATEYAKRTGKVLDIEKACQQAEEYLKEMWLKGKGFIEDSPSSEQSQSSGPRSQPEPQYTTRGLSSSMAPMQSTGVVPAKTDRERMERALAKLK